MQIKNYFKIDKFNPFREKYMFIDLPEYLADDIFVRNELSVKFGKEYEKPEEKYVFVFCTIWKKDREKFEVCMKQLETKMLLMGHTDYTEFCKKWDKLFKKEG